MRQIRQTRKPTSRTAARAFGASARVGHDASRFYARRLYDAAVNGAAVNGAADSAPAPAAAVPPRVRNRIFCHDARKMKHLPDNCAALMVTSPPYNVGKEYDEDLSLADYQDLLRKVLAETHRVLQAGGRACINVANIGRKPYISLAAVARDAALAAGFLPRGEIIWDKGASAGTSCAWGSWRSASNPVLRDVHEYILVFSKEGWRRVRPPAGGDSISREDFLESTKSIWRFPAASARRARHPAPFPPELPRRLMELYAFKGELVLDPFMGSGTTACAALETGRAYVGYEINAAYAKIARAHIAATKRALAARRRTP